jgi:3-methyladenine DNA glycosylase/8-oxoguanine DNA glycosylase
MVQQKKVMARPAMIENEPYPLDRAMVVFFAHPPFDFSVWSSIIRFIIDQQSRAPFWPRQAFLIISNFSLNPAHRQFDPVSFDVS